MCVMNCSKTCVEDPNAALLGHSRIIIHITRKRSKIRQTIQIRNRAENTCKEGNPEYRQRIKNGSKNQANTQNHSVTTYKASQGMTE